MSKELEEAFDIAIEALWYTYDHLRGALTQPQVANIRCEVGNAIEEIEQIHPT